MIWDTELILRIGCCGCFFGHGFIAAYKLEFGGWSKFMYAAGFREAEAHARRGAALRHIDAFLP